MSRKDFQSLTIKDSFLFYAVMMDAGQCRRLLELILEIEIERVTVCCEDTLTYHPEYHGVRLDVLAREKGKQRRFNVEMQARKETDIAQRSRYYHSQLDMDALLTGASYGALPDTYVIFICDFDPCGQGLYRYEFLMTCKETQAQLNDGIHTIFLSTKGKNRNAVPKALLNFLQYVENPGRASESDDAFVLSLEAQIASIKRNREWRNKYMLLELTLQKERSEGRREGREEGREEGRLRQLIELSCRKLAKGKSCEEIADELEMDAAFAAQIVEAAGRAAPDYDTDRIIEILDQMRQQDMSEKQKQPKHT